MLAIGLLTVVSGALGLTYATSREVDLGAPDVPFMAAELTGIIHAGVSRGLPLTGPDVILYVSEHCPYCRAETSAWEKALSLAPAGMAPLLVLSPGSSVVGLDYLPPSLRTRWIWDSTGDIGRSLGVRAVPYTAELSGKEVVRVRVGRSTPAQIDSMVDVLGRRPRGIPQ